MHAHRLRGCRVPALLLFTLLAACSGGGGGASPTAPTAPAPAPSGPLLLVAGNSNAFFLAPYLDGAIDHSNIDGSIDFWLSSPAFSEAARNPSLSALIWWQAGSDIFSPGDEYADKLRRVIRIVRASQPELPVRIIELPDLPNRAVLRDAQRLVASDPRVELIPTADLEWADAVGHFTPAAYRTVRDRIYRSLGR